MKKGRNLAIIFSALAMSSLQSQNRYGIGFGSPHPKAKSPKDPFTPEELDKLAQLSGKAKKAFLRELREKYRAGRVQKLMGEL